MFQNETRGGSDSTAAVKATGLGEEKLWSPREEVQYEANTHSCKVQHYWEYTATASELDGPEENFPREIG